MLYYIIGVFVCFEFARLNWKKKFLDLNLNIILSLRLREFPDNCICFAHQGLIWGLVSYLDKFPPPSSPLLTIWKLSWSWVINIWKWFIVHCKHLARSWHNSHYLAMSVNWENKIVRSMFEGQKLGATMRLSKVSGLETDVVIHQLNHEI
jgi:hypothetical protein